MRYPRRKIVAAAPMTRQTTASRVRTPAISLRCNDQPASDHRPARPRGWRLGWLLGRLEDIPRSPQRMDHRRAPGVDLLAQVRDVQLDHVGLAPEVVVPHPVQDLGLAQ